MWSILTASGKEGRRWEPEEFFETGRVEINRLLATLGHLGLMPHRGTALDFGCGVGRLTRALAESFDHATGIDISEEMVAEALSAARRSSWHRVQILRRGRLGSGNDWLYRLAVQPARSPAHATADSLGIHSGVRARLIARRLCRLPVHEPDGGRRIANPNAGPPQQGTAPAPASPTVVTDHGDARYADADCCRALVARRARDTRGYCGRCGRTPARVLPVCHRLS